MLPIIGSNITEVIDMIEDFDKWASIPENRDLLYDILDKQFPHLKEDEEDE